jgi:HD-GYP domain-containing protein (c-di-GMP phosphodiesterase class II)
MQLLEERGDLAVDAAVHALVSALAESDGETHAHSHEVAATARAVGLRLRLDAGELAEVELAALLHDVGKLRLPRRLLMKPGRLTEHERRLIRLHPDWGADMVGEIPGLEGVALIVRLHHERPDGCGYPLGLTREQIPMAARIVAVCDAYGAMTQRRPYSAPLDVEEALAELERHSGAQFDPDVVEALTAIVRLPERVPA